MYRLAQATMLSHFLLKPRASRVNRFMNVRIKRLCQSTCDVQMDLFWTSWKYQRGPVRLGFKLRKK